MNHQQQTPLGNTPKKQTMSSTRLFFAITLIAAVVATAGCAAKAKPPDPQVADASAPQLVTNLKSLSDQPVEVNPFHFNGSPQTNAILHVPDGASSGPRTFQATPGVVRMVGDDANPGEERLLNAKATQFANFSTVILEHIYAQLRVAERTEEIAGLRLPTDLKPVIITAIMDKDGKLTELILEQHSGKAAIDKMMLDVCSRGIWYRNPPPAALSGGNTYQFTIQCRLENFDSTGDSHWSFKTYLGLGLA